MRLRRVASAFRERARLPLLTVDDVQSSSSGTLSDLSFTIDEADLRLIGPNGGNGL
jgi:ABC-type uncharacterized transport system ATPase subunit